MARKKTTWRNWFLLLLAGLLVALFFAVNLARQNYEAKLRRQIWPVAAPELSIRQNAPGGPFTTVLLLGDSRMAQWNLPKLTHWRVVNAGTGGLTSGQILAGTAKVLDEFHPEVVVIEAGINDLKYLGLRPEMATTLISLVASNLTAIVVECRKRHCQILVLEIWPAGEPSLARRLVWSEAISASVIELNARLRTLDAPAQGTRVVDLFHEAGLKLGPERYRDTLHFQPEVYRQLTPALEKRLDAWPVLPN